MASIVCQKLVGFPSRRRLCCQPEFHPRTTQKSVQAVGHAFGDNPGFSFRRIVKKPRALAAEVSIKEPEGVDGQM
ncbi:beta-amylase [Artemisia annua]|uniref:Beta-amylase n=1 Tax=Artemisia annua TaxID=35608 RepID=A0A2U1PCA9_ARTAN|nr:beta-amylase [Artemisia annua]